MPAKLIVTGNLVKDPEINTTSGGTTICNITLATNRKTKKGDEWVEETEYTNAFCFGKPGEAIGKYMKKGCKMYIDGDKITDIVEKDGGKKYFVKCKIDNFEFLTWPKRDDGYSNQSDFSQPDPGDDGDIPF